MSLSMHLKRAEGSESSIAVCGQTTATEFVGRLALKHDFCILVGIYPTWATHADIQQLLREFEVIREASRSELASNSDRSPDDRAYVDRRWANLIEFLRPLASETNWDLMIG